MARRLGWIVLMLAAWGGVAVAQDGVPASDCEMCHDEAVPAFAAGPHGRAMRARSDELFQGSCEACHGPAADHVDDPSTENIVRWPGRDACVTCHGDRASKMELLVPAHNRHGISCLDCHDSGHADSGVDWMLQKEPRNLCADCHPSEAATFTLPFAHRDGTEPFQCTACHSVHGDTRVGRLNLLRGEGACVDCHTGQARPYVFEHPPVSRPGCEACHMPHGSTNPRMLTRRDVSMLCLECHAGVPAFHDIASPRYKNCQSCHAAVHGSNRDPQLFEE